MKGSDAVFRIIVGQPLSALVFSIAAILIFKMNSHYLGRNLYVEELGSDNEKKVSTDYPFLNRFGRTGELAALELKLILRHKRSRVSFFMGFLFLLYGFLFYKQEVIAANAFGQMMFGAIFMTGISILMKS